MSTTEKEVEELAAKMGAKYDNFWRDVDDWDTSGYIPGENHKTGWGEWCYSKYIDNLMEVIGRYKIKEKKRSIKMKDGCSFYRKGNCNFGNKCKYLHI
jgi:hypothetical protein